LAGQLESIFLANSVTPLTVGCTNIGVPKQVIFFLPIIGTFACELGSFLFCELFAQVGQRAADAASARPYGDGGCTGSRDGVVTG
jgi:hypothetical protein